MNIKDIKKSQSKLENVLSGSIYVSHRYSSRVIDEIEEMFPSSLAEYVQTYINPFTLLPFLALKRQTTNFEASRVQSNEKFIDKEIATKSDFFDKAAAFPLDNQQRRAVVADEDNNLVIAGAGSGKTMTIVAKVKYLTEILGVSADTILPISFTKKSADEMKDRINIRGVNPQTFHKFGLTVLQSVEQRRPKIFKPEENKGLFRSFIEELSQDDEYLPLLNDFLINYIKVPKSQFEFESLGDYIQYMKDQNFSTYKLIKMKNLFKGKETFRNEVVKSIEECIIANFLIFNRVEYEYEKQYEKPYPQFGRKRSYKPDFTITGKNGLVYLEHLGMDRNGSVPKFFAGPNESHYDATRKYKQMLEWKRRVHSQNGTSLIESYSYEFQEGTLISELKKKLRSTGVELKPMDPKEVWEVIEKSSKDQVDGFIELCGTFLALLKSNNYSIEDAKRFNRECKEDQLIKTRSSKFIQLFEPFFSMYENHLLKKGEIDFNDMITRATEYIEEGKHLLPLDYVIIDEFQDLSIGRYRILNAIRKQNPGVKFYCVGDDWQSIYRFAGADITLFSDFEKHFGVTYTSKIETTYRFNNPLIGLSSKFILKNPHQLSKTLKSPNNAPDTLHSIIESDSSFDDDTDALVESIDIFLKDGLNPQKDTVYLIGRYNFDIQRIKNRDRSFSISFSNGLIKYPIPSGKYKGKTLNIHFITAHKAKGLEADYTVIVNCNSGKFGFPSGRADDKILNLLLSSSDQFENGEERRLFYVAMTRTKRRVIFITSKYRKSKFIKEIQGETSVEGATTTCPRCGNGELVKRSGPGYLFYGCTNWAYGCKYSTSTPPPEVKTQPIKSTEQEYPEVEENDITAPKGAEPKAPRPASAVSRGSASKLTKSQSNKLEFFCKSPRSYSSSEKAREKVRYLVSISKDFNDVENEEFTKALSVWKKNLS